MLKWSGTKTEMTVTYGQLFSIACSKTTNVDQFYSIHQVTEPEYANCFFNRTNIGNEERTKILDCPRKSSSEWSVRLSRFNPGSVNFKSSFVLLIKPRNGDFGDSDSNLARKDPSGPSFTPDSMHYYLGTFKNGNCHG